MAEPELMSIENLELLFLLNYEEYLGIAWRVPGTVKLMTSEQRHDVVKLLFRKSEDLSALQERIEDLYMEEVIAMSEQEQEGAEGTEAEEGAATEEGDGGDGGEAAEPEAE